jgi:HSP90 family molecular chaperone
MVEKKLDDSETKTFSMLLYDVARITSGYEISDSGEFAKRVMSLMIFHTHLLFLQHHTKA